jgi:invasion protein IalB
MFDKKDFSMTLAASVRAFAAGAFCAALIAATPAMAQDAAAPAAPAAPQARDVVLKADPSQANWVKLCGKDPGTQREICFTQRSFVTETNQPVLAMAVYDTKGQEQKFIRFILPLGFLLERGMRYTVDKNKPATGKFQICLPNGCFAEVAANPEQLKALKEGTTLKIEVQNQANQIVSFQLALDGFGAAFDGPAVDPKVIQEQNKKLEEELAKRVEEQKKLLQKQSGDAPAQ